MKTLDKAGQVGLTITWITAFIVIFVIMLIFISMSFSLIGNKRLSGEKNFIEISERKDSGALDNQRKLFFLLGSITESKETIKDLIFKWKLSDDELIKEEVEIEITSILENLKKDSGCYLFVADYDVSKSPEEYIWISNEINKDYLEFVGEGYLVFEKEISKLDLFFNNQEINVMFYSGKC
ncbi:MAG: hypothetical protein KKF68_03085 [Nanoarchaeota archaeon]|nr:hypothetical protein [Nanoarchaeota archaeon]